MNITCTCGQPIQDPGRHLCQDCTNQLTRNISRIPSLMHDLDVEVTMQAVKLSSAGNGEGSVGFDVFASELIDELREILGGIETMIGAKPQGTIKQRVAHLVKHHREIPKHASSTGWDADLKDAIRAATRKIDAQPERLDLGECECGARIIAARGAKYTKCRFCDAVWDNAELVENRRLATIEALDGAFLPVKDIAAALEVIGYPTSANTIKEWGRRGKLTASAEPEKSTGGRPGKKYLVNDAVELASRRICAKV